MPRKASRKSSADPLAKYKLTTRPDTLDLRDQMYVPTLVEVPTTRDLDAYRKAQVPVLNQGSEGACTGYGLATLVHYLLRTRQRVRDAEPISPQMLYDLARRYDEWPGEKYEGSSCRGAMKGWQKHGVCAAGLWETSGGTTLTYKVTEDAAKRPLGAYFRVNHRDLVAMHAAITEVGVLYVSSNVHSGWGQVGKDGRITMVDDNVGGHAFAIVAYDTRGFWIQNSWGEGWGKGGYGHIGYEDWLKNGSDAWVARLAVPVELPAVESGSAHNYAGTVRSKAYSYNELRPHVISLGNDGKLDPGGNIGTTPELVREIIHKDIPRITKGWKTRRIVLYAHGGLVNEDSALQRIADYRQPMLDAQCYPLAFIWHSDAWNTIKNILEDAGRRRRPEGFLDGAKDFLLDRLDDLLEPTARLLGGRTMWCEMKENALLATTDADGGGRLVLDELRKLAASDPTIEFHVIGHSAGSILLTPIVQYLCTTGVIQGGSMDGVTGLALKLASATLWAPAITTQLFKAAWLPALGSVGRFAAFTLDDQTEQDDNCAGIYHKSLLYLVSNAFEDTMRIPLIHPEGEPLLGMQKYIEADRTLKKLFGPAGSADWVLAPNRDPDNTATASRAGHHGDFDNDTPTIQATLARILNKKKSTAEIKFASSLQRHRATRLRIEQAV